ncbi:MAG: adenylosuccinate lyase [Solitalea-like symbiont of Tyrophagus putrescentiae]
MDLLSPLISISPIDGRYYQKCSELSKYFSEAALIKYRIFVEIEYFIALKNLNIPELQSLDISKLTKIRELYDRDMLKTAKEVKKIEETTKHDIKALEYFIKNYFKEISLEEYSEFIHFGLTSQDINNTAIPLLFKDAIMDIYRPLLDNIIDKLSKCSYNYNNTVVLARTHGQPASPTILGKEFLVFIKRLKEQLKLFSQIPFSAKFSGATGNFNSLYLAYPDIDWFDFADKFINDNLKLHRSHPTTQIEHYDNFAAQCDTLKRINTILIDFCQDIWLYISLNYFKQKINKDEVGSSAMPHKVNPIDFENAEGNLKLANAIFNFLSDKLPVSRLQRDLTDSTVLRNIGVPIAHTIISMKSILQGLDKLTVNREAINIDLNNNAAVITEGLQTMLRKIKYKNPYEKFKELSRVNKNIKLEDIYNFIDTLDIDSELKQKLKTITPNNYYGKH